MAGPGPPERGSSVASVRGKREARERRHRRVRRIVRGTAERPRLCVFKSARHLYAQVIDDVQGKTLAAASTAGKDGKAPEGGAKGKIEAARRVGAQIAEKAMARQVLKVVFDRNGFLYHGRVKALAEAAREKGLDF